MRGPFRMNPVLVVLLVFFASSELGLRYGQDFASLQSAQSGPSDQNRSGGFVLARSQAVRGPFRMNPVLVVLLVFFACSELGLRYGQDFASFQSAQSGPSDQNRSGGSVLARSQAVRGPYRMNHVLVVLFVFFAGSELANEFALSANKKSNAFRVGFLWSG